MAGVTCGGHLGAAFFVEPDVLATNAHVACPLNTTQTVTLQDGRSLSGTTIWREELLDLARIRVPGAGSPVLPLGDATNLVPGQPVVFVGSPGGLDFTSHQGNVSYVGRAIMGVAHIQFEGAVNPGNSGGPLLDREGRVIGVVTLKDLKLEHVGMAVPVHYLQPPPAGEPVEERWKALLVKAEAESKREAKRIVGASTQPIMVGVRRDPKTRALMATFVRRWPQGTPTEAEHHFTLEVDGSPVCELRAWVRRWLPMLSNEAEGSFRQQQLDDWSRKYAKGEELFIGAGNLRVVQCSSVVSGAGTLIFEEGAPSENRFDLSAEDVLVLVPQMRPSKGGKRPMEYSNP